MTLLEEALYSSGQLSISSINDMTKLWNKRKMLKSKEALISFDQTDSHLYFIDSGCLRLFVVDHTFEEKNIGFGYSNTFITNFHAFITRKPSMLNLEAIVDTRVTYISRENLENLMEINPEVAKWYRTMLERTLSGHIQRQIELLTLTPQERYEVFQKRSGHLINTIPLKLIASYLMMTPETLSRIRANIS